MPKPFVTEALGKPIEIRAPRAGEPGTEVWVYPKAGEVMRVGFQNNAVSWIRSDTTTAETKPATPGEREARVRAALKVGRPCNSVLQETGAPDREETLQAGTTSSARYVYAFDAANANAYAAFICVAGRVTSVERFTPETGPAEPRDAPR
jgi:hypothetical protein